MMTGLSNNCMKFSRLDFISIEAHPTVMFVKFTKMVWLDEDDDLSTPFRCIKMVIGGNQFPIRCVKTRNQICPIIAEQATDNVSIISSGFLIRNWTKIGVPKLQHLIHIAVNNFTNFASVSVKINGFSTGRNFHSSSLWSFASSQEYLVIRCAF